MEIIYVLAALAPMLALLGVVWLVTRKLGERAKLLRMEHEKLESVVAGHRDMAEALESSLQELAPWAKAHREAAVDHAQRAEDLEARIERERRQAEFHEQRAAQTDDEREQLR